MSHVLQTHTDVTLAYQLSLCHGFVYCKVVIYVMRWLCRFILVILIFFYMYETVMVLISLCCYFSEHCTRIRMEPVIYTVTVGIVLSSDGFMGANRAFAPSPLPNNVCSPQNEASTELSISL